MRVRKSKSFLNRVALTFFGTHVVASAIVLGVLGVWIANHERDAAQRTLEAFAAVQARQFGPQMANGSFNADIRKIDPEADAFDELRVALFDRSGSLITGEPQPAQRFRAEIEQALRTGTGTAQRRDELTRTTMLHVARRVEHEGQMVGVIRVSMPRASIDAAVRSYLVFWGSGLLLMTLFVGSALLLLTRWMSRQVSALAKDAGHFAEGNLSHRVTPPDIAELATLAEHLNTMARQMSRRVDQAESQEREMRAILQSMSNGMIALDVDQRILNMNRAARAIFEVGGAMVDGRLLQEVIREPEVHRYVDRAMTQWPVAPIEIELARGRSGRVQITGELLRDRDGAIQGILLMLQDVTRLRRLESMRSDFAANVSHELRTPITNIKGYVETLLDVGLHEDGEQSRKFLSIIKQNSDRLAAIVEDVLALTRLEDDRVGSALDRTPTRVETIFRTVVSQFTDRSAEKSITIQANAPADLEVSIHAPLIEQAIGNLLSNAINYSPPGTLVELRGYEPDKDCVAIEVRDQGPGIAREHISRLFERFYRVDKGRSRELGGTGLGLAIVKHIMNVHGGRVEVDSTVGKGSTFRLVISRPRQVEELPSDCAGADRASNGSGVVSEIDSQSI